MNWSSSYAPSGAAAPVGIYNLFPQAYWELSRVEKRLATG